MAINIKDPAADSLIRKLSATTGFSITDAVNEAVTLRLEAVEQRHRRASRRTNLQRYLDRARARKVDRGQSEDEIFGFGADGIPE